MALAFLVLGCSVWLGSYPNAASRVLRRHEIAPTLSEEDLQLRYGSAHADSRGGTPRGGSGSTDFEALIEEADLRARADGGRRGITSRLRDAGFQAPFGEAETQMGRRAGTPWPSEGDLRARRDEVGNDASRRAAAQWPAWPSVADFHARLAEAGLDAGRRGEPPRLSEAGFETRIGEAGRRESPREGRPGASIEAKHEASFREATTNRSYPETKSKAVHLVFRLDEAETDMGEYLLVVGSHSALGNWDPANGLRMTTNEKTYPSWTARLPVSVSGALEYKYVRDRSCSGEPFEWEEGANRRVEAPLGDEGDTWEQHDAGMGVPGSRLVRLEDSQVAQQPEPSIPSSSAVFPSSSAVLTPVVYGDADATTMSEDSEDSPEDRLIFESHNVRSTISVSNGHNMMQRIASLSVFDQLIDDVDELADLRAKREEEEAKLEDRPERYAAKHLNTPIVIVASELNPWSKTGGLAMIASSYAFEFSLRGHRTMAVAPMYDDYENMRWVGSKAIELAGGFHEVNYFLHRKTYGPGKICDYVFVSHPCYRRSEGIYGPPGEEYDDNLFRFALLSLAAADAPLVVEIDGSTYGQDVLFIANDWQTGVLPVYLLYKYKMHNVYQNARSILVIHNIGYQGKYSKSKFPLDEFLHLPANLADKDLQGEDMHLGDDCINLLAGGIRTADRVLTVSPNYANEIQSPEGGNGLHEDLQQRGRELRLAGILNGISDEWSPSTDKMIPRNYHLDDFEEGKLACKTALQQELGLKPDSGVCLIGFCGRLCFQKGLTLIMELLDWLMHGQPSGCQLILMGKGEDKLSAQVANAESNHRGRICGYVGFDPSVERRMMAGCDILLMPSQYEPCGLPQMYAQAYGTLPVVHETGGLKDSVRGLWDDTHIEVATGFLFSGFNADSLKHTLSKALDTFHHRREILKKMQTNAMKRNFYWPNAMDEYERHVDWTLENSPHKKVETWWQRQNGA